MPEDKIPGGWNIFADPDHRGPDLAEFYRFCVRRLESGDVILDSHLLSLLNEEPPCCSLEDCDSVARKCCRQN